MKEGIDRSIASVVSSTRFIFGSQVAELGGKLAEYVGVKHCIPCGNGKGALTIALMAWGVGEGDAVFVSDFTFLLRENARLASERRFFVDVDEHNYIIDPVKLEESIVKVRDEKIPSNGGGDGGSFRASGRL